MYGTRAGIKIWIQICSLYSKNILHGLREVNSLCPVTHNLFYFLLIKNWNVTWELISTNENGVSICINITAYEYLYFWQENWTPIARIINTDNEVNKWTNWLSNYQMPGWFNLSTFWLENSCTLIHCIKLNWYYHKVSS